MSGQVGIAKGLDPLSLEHATKLHLVFWYCQIRSGRWPKSFPYCKPANWDSMNETDRSQIPAVIELKRVVTTRYSAKDLCLVYNILGFGGADMSADEVVQYWEHGGWADWGTRMAG